MIRSFPQHEFDDPSQELAVVYYSNSRNSKLKNLPDHRSPLIKMHIKSKRSCLNVDNIAGLQSIVCRGDQMHMHLSTQISISHWNISNGVTFLINPHWNCLGNQKAVFLHSEAYRIKSLKELIFNVEIVHPTDVIDEYEFIIRPNNEYHRSLLLGNSQSSLKMDKNSDSILEKQDSKGNVFDMDFSNKSWNMIYSGTIPRQTVSATLHCISCRVSGTAALYSNLKGSTKSNKVGAIFKTGIASAFNANLSMILEIKDGFRMIGWRNSIFKLDIFPFSIPGLLKLEAAIWIDAAMYFSLVGKGNITIDFLFNQSQSLTEVEIGEKSQTLNATRKPIAHIGLQHPFMDFSGYGAAMIAPSIGLRFGLFDKPIESILAIHYDVGVSSEISNGDPFQNDQNAIFSECPIGTYKYSKDIFFKPTAKLGSIEHYIWRPYIENVHKGCISRSSLALIV